MLGKPAGLELWGAARGEHVALIRGLGATPIDYKREDFTRVLPGGFDVVFDGIGEDGFRGLFAALSRRGELCAHGDPAGVQAQRRMPTILMWIARLYLWRWLPGGKRAGFYSINLMRALHPAWFQADLEQLFGLLANGTQPGYVLQSGSPLMRSPRRTAVLRQAVSKASSSSCAGNFSAAMRAASAFPAAVEDAPAATATGGKNLRGGN